MFISSILAGTLSGWSSIIVCYPFDNIRTRLQTEHFGLTVKDSIKTVYNNYGLKGFYKGFTAPFMAQGLYKSIIFTTNNYSTLILTKISSNYSHNHNNSNNNNIICFLSGLIAGSVNALIVCPVELIRNQQLLERSKNNININVIDCIKKIKSTNGIFGLYRGINLTIIRDGIGLGVYFLTYKLTKESLGDSIISRLIAGSSAGIMFWALLLPIDTMKSMIQSVDLNENIKFRDIISNLNKLSITLIFKRLYSSWMIAVARGVPGAAITLTTYDFAHKYICEYLE